MADIRLKLFADRPPEFWTIMGPVFASDRIRREMPYLRDEPSRIWVIAFDEPGMAGFASMTIEGSEGKLHALWVRGNLRGTSQVAKILIDTCLKYLAAVGCKTATVTANGRSRPQLARAGFCEIGARGRYTTMSKELDDDDLSRAVG